MRRSLPLLLVPLLFAPAACAKATNGSHPGGPVTPTSIPIDIGPSAKVAGNTMPTGIAVNGKELVLYILVFGNRPQLDAAVRDTATGKVDPNGEGLCTGGTGSDDQNPFFGLHQCVATDGSLIEYGAYKGAVSRITSQADGTSTDATFARWTDTPAGSAPAQAPVVVFWLQRHGKPAPSSVAVEGKTSPLPAAQYPRITVYSPNGKAVASANLRPGITEQQSV
ncbi:hypothetical protein ACQP2P_29705 [Dactylosporangium sp. CA-139114]|uniref:hypothetical protein n=1 Tax=Dactylosporangium sp. CA-139114 TaxID=3239931 RepID=UPI003D99474C